ncbi:MAG: hypothetical protein JSU84_03350, partial [Thiotrichales bacterium]
MLMSASAALACALTVNHGIEYLLFRLVSLSWLVMLKTCAAAVYIILGVKKPPFRVAMAKYPKVPV